jgi:D-glycero-D-manno-heptose 1,7-bisphosphate phosphatase
MNKPAVFLDRDGVIILEKDFQRDAERMEFYPDTVSSLKTIDSRFAKIVISNQSGIARGYFTAEDVLEFNKHLSGRLNTEGIGIDAWYFCPHGPDDECLCRKPNPGMIVKAADEHSLDLNNSWIVGDKSSDIIAGQRAGIKTILVRTGYSGKEPGAEEIAPDFVADNLSGAVALINGSVD